MGTDSRPEIDGKIGVAFGATMTTFSPTTIRLSQEPNKLKLPPSKKHVPSNLTVSRMLPHKREKLLSKLQTKATEKAIKQQKRLDKEEEEY